MIKRSTEISQHFASRACQQPNLTRPGHSKYSNGPHVSIKPFLNRASAPMSSPPFVSIYVDIFETLIRRYRFLRYLIGFSCCSIFFRNRFHRVFVSFFLRLVEVKIVTLRCQVRILMCDQTLISMFGGVVISIWMCVLLVASVGVIILILFSSLIWCVKLVM